MIEIGKYNELQVIKEVDFGLYLSDDNRIEEILLPIKYVPIGTEIGDRLNVFVYNDSENRPIATTLKSLGSVGEFVSLTVIDEADFGVFMDLGIAKDVFVPLKEQAIKMKVGKDYVVYLYIDHKSGRIVATTKWTKYLDNEHLTVKEGDEVQLLIAEQTDLGFKAIINQKHLGLIYKNEIFEPVSIGAKKRGFIKKIREGNKIDLSLQIQGYGHIEDTKSRILHELRLNNGFLGLNDKSTPEEVYDKLNLSKKAFKKIIGGLYKEGMIEISDKGISLVNEE